METGTLVTLALYFVLMLGIGLYAWRRSTGDSAGYLLAGRSLSPAVAALSAGASDMSGWLLLGLPGALYASGLVEAWIAIGLFAGAWVNWVVVPPRLRQQSEERGALTIPGFLAARFPDRFVIGADQVLDLDGAPLSKPRDIAEATERLRRLRRKRKDGA